jgi:hypothetical protein
MWLAPPSEPPEELLHALLLLHVEVGPSTRIPKAVLAVDLANFEPNRLGTFVQLLHRYRATRKPRAGERRRGYVRCWEGSGGSLQNASDGKTEKRPNGSA